MAAILLLTPGNKRVTSHISETSALAQLTGAKMITANNTPEKEIILNYRDFDEKYESAAGDFFFSPFNLYRPTCAFAF